ncbi:MAG: hypothetical protein FJ160_00920 [Gammaproteobacteria bacterium]|nr:hypothetical protein [Gammaproteobacteria bacterium]
MDFAATAAFAAGALTTAAAGFCTDLEAAGLGDAAGLGATALAAFAAGLATGLITGAALRAAAGRAGFLPKVALLFFLMGCLSGVARAGRSEPENIRENAVSDQRRPVSLAASGAARTACATRHQLSQFRAFVG